MYTPLVNTSLMYVHSLVNIPLMYTPLVQVNIPLVYTQLVQIAVHIYFLFTLFGTQVVEL